MMLEPGGEGRDKGVQPCDEDTWREGQGTAESNRDDEEGSYHSGSI